MDQQSQDLYASTHQSLLFMLSELYTAVEDATCPEEATPAEFADLNRIHSTIVEAYNILINGTN